MTISSLFLLLTALSVKHFIADYVLQTSKLVQLKQKNILYLFLHAFHHALGSFIIFVFVASFPIAIGLSLLDWLLHTIIDSTKSYVPYFDRFKPPSQAYFNILGLDQLMHQLCYILYVYLLTRP